MTDSKLDSHEVANTLAVHATATLMNCGSDHMVVKELLQQNRDLVQDAADYPNDITDNEVQRLAQAYQHLALMFQVSISRHMSYAETMKNYANDVLDQINNQ